MSAFDVTPTGAVALTGSARIEPAAPPRTYLGMAEHFANGLVPLKEAGPTCAVPLAFLSAQVAECALKAFLSRNGDDTRLKKKELRHNLKALWELAQSEGLPLLDSPSWLTRLGSLHDSPFYLRYSTGVHAMVSPGAEPMCSELQALVVLVRQNLP